MSQAANQSPTASMALSSHAATAPNAGMADLINPPAAAHELGLTTKTLSNWRLVGRGPAFYKIGGKVMYRLSEVRAWLAQQRRTSTTDPGCAA